MTNLSEIATDDEDEIGFLDFGCGLAFGYEDVTNGEPVWQWYLFTFSATGDHVRTSLDGVVWTSELRAIDIENVVFSKETIACINKDRIAYFKWRACNPKKDIKKKARMSTPLKETEETGLDMIDVVLPAVMISAMLGMAS